MRKMQPPLPDVRDGSSDRKNRDPLAEAQAKSQHMKEVWREETEFFAIWREMDTLTYAVVHNPNCPSPFLVRLCGSMVLDYQPHGTTRDILGFGKTRTEAAKEALAKLRKHRDAHMKRAV